MSEDLRTIKLALQRALNLTLQGSYERRAPARGSVPLLEQARSDLESWIAQRGESAEALRLVALSNEALLDYDAAAQALEKAMKLSPRVERKDMRRLVAYRQASRVWKNLMLSGLELVALGTYLKAKLLDTAPERSLQWTEDWLRKHKPAEMCRILTSLKKLGYPSDYHVLHNLVPG